MASPDAARSAGRRGIVAVIFADRAEAEEALRELRERGFRPEEIGVAMRHASDARELAETVSETEAEEGAAIGAVAGGVLGGAAGWLVGIGALLIPGIGPIVAAGPLAVALGALVVGAATGGLVGALVGEGIPEEQARWYEEAIRSGAVLITVRAGGRSAEAREALREAGGVEAREGADLPAPELRPASPTGEDTEVVGAAGPPLRPRSELTAEWPPIVPSQPASEPIVTPPVGPAPVLPAPVSAYYGPMPASAQQHHAQRYHREEAEGMAEMRGTTREMMGSAREVARGITEGQPVESLSGIFSFMEQVPTSTYYFAMLASILGSLYLFTTGRKWESLFVGLWAPTIISSAMFYKLLRPSREIR